MDHIQIIKNSTTKKDKIIFISGIFNIIHPGHLRLLKFASECGSFLVVGLLNDTTEKFAISADMRLEAMQAISFVNYSFILNDSIENILIQLKPDIVVKGKEFENSINKEQSILNSYGGKLIFTSGEVLFSSLDLIRREFLENHNIQINKPLDFLQRHSINTSRSIEILRKFTNLNILVIGDLIVDEYINCDTLGLSQEDPTIVVTPLDKRLFIGGAGIVAAHALGLGSGVNFITICGDDESGKFVKNYFSKQKISTNIIIDKSRPTTLKQRFRAKGKTLLRVSHLKKHDVSIEISNKILSILKKILISKRIDVLIFSDFNYGCLPQSLIDKIINLCNSYHENLIMTADNQSSSQIGDISKYKNMKLITPTEYEARISMRDFNSGLITLLEALHRKTNSENIFITLGSEGLLIHSKDNQLSHKFYTDQLLALNSSPKDVSGAGDSLLVTTSLAYAAGANSWEAAYLGSIAAACQVGRVGNTPLNVTEVINCLKK